jgi:thiamine-monophosphate kinase
VGAIVQLGRLPFRPEVKEAFGEKSLEMALSGGEDYQLLFTAEPAIIEKVCQASAYPVTVIGDIVAENAGQVILMDEEGKRSQLEKAGWDHFKKSK